MLLEPELLGAGPPSREQSIPGFSSRSNKKKCLGSGWIGPSRGRAGQTYVEKLKPAASERIRRPFGPPKPWMGSGMSPGVPEALGGGFGATFTGAQVDWLPPSKAPPRPQGPEQDPVSPGAPEARSPGARAAAGAASANGTNHNKDRHRQAAAGQYRRGESRKYRRGKSKR